MSEALAFSHPPLIQKLTPAREAVDQSAPHPALKDFVAELEARQRQKSESASQHGVWEPQPGPQTSFKNSDVYELLYGGAAGGGKTWALSHEGLQYAVDGGRALYLRRTFPELQEVIDLLIPKIREHGGTWQEQKKRATFPNGGVLQFGFCQTYREVLQYQGQQFGWIGYDELGLVAEERVWTYLISRNRGIGKLPKRMRASANPGGVGHHWIKRRFIATCAPDGTAYDYKLPNGQRATRGFIQSFLKDNKALVENDPEYADRLEMLPDLEKRWLKDGDWNAGAGAALTELARERHLVKPYVIPSHHRWFGAFDWGYNHPFSFGFYAVDEDGNITKVETVSGRRLQPNEIARRIKEAGKRLAEFGFRGEYDYIVAGHDCWADVKARSENIPTIAEAFYDEGLTLDRANISRVAGVQNMRRYLRWKDADNKEHNPRFRMFRTEQNLKGYEVLETRISDPQHPEDILKTDADQQGDGGDDFYDETRYGLASRPIIPGEAPAAPRVTHPDLQDTNEIFIEGADDTGEAPFSQLPHGF